MSKDRIRPEGDFSRPFNRGNLDAHIKLDHSTTCGGLMKQVVNAYKEGITCFRFTFEHNGRKFEDGIALRPEVHDEADAMEMATDIWAMFCKTVQKVIREGR